MGIQGSLVEGESFPKEMVKEINVLFFVLVENWVDISIYMYFDKHFCTDSTTL